LTQIVLEGGNLDGIAAEVARVLDVGVLFTSTDGRERAAALTDELREQLVTHDFVDPTGRLRYVVADLTADAGWDEAVSGCTAVQPD